MLLKAGIWEVFILLTGVVVGRYDPSCAMAETALQTVALSNTAFSSSMYRVLTEGAGDDENLIFSPYSISAVMAMVKLGANGTTAVDIRNAMKYPESDETLGKGYKMLMEILQKPNDFTLETVNKIYAMIGFTMKVPFTSQLREYFNATIDQLDFSDGEGAAKEINSFVERATKNNIKDLVKPDDFSCDTRLVLINAIYFKGSWLYPFRKLMTTVDDFYTGEEGKNVKVPMMRLGRRLPYGDIPDLNARAVALPYSGDKLCMLILLPNQRHGLKEMEVKLSTSNFNFKKLLEDMNNDTYVDLKMPKFKLQSKIDLRDPLMKLGAGSIFRSPDFSNIQDASLTVSKALQKAFIEVNEEGSKAAAATVVEMEERSIGGGPYPPVAEFNMDHPFLAIIAYKLDSEYEILFMSKVSSPPPAEGSSSGPKVEQGTDDYQYRVRGLEQDRFSTEKIVISPTSTTNPSTDINEEWVWE